VQGVELLLDVREPTGWDELFLLETRLSPSQAMAGLAERVARQPGAPAIDWRELPAVRLAEVALLLRREWFGDRVISDGVCLSAGCGERFDISLSVSSYVAAHRPRIPRSVVVKDGGWYELRTAPVRFRIPTVHDLLAVLAAPDAADALVASCVEPGQLTARQVRSLDTALAALAPDLVDRVGGACPECGGEVALTFDPLNYCLAELRDHFAAVYREVHLLAATYHWSEEAILRLSRTRRRRYTSMIAEMATL
jgi:hypothetical protein